MSVIHLPNGIGDTLGDALVTNSPLEVNGNVWYVHYGTGTDAVSPAGQNRQDPLKTLGQAVTNSAAGDVIVLMDGHEETIAATVTINKHLTIVGAGSSGGYPTVKLANNQAAAAMIACTTNACLHFRNIWFEEEVQANSSPKITTNSVYVFCMENCYMQLGQYDDDFGVELGSTIMAMFRNCTFISTATSVATQPYAAVGVNTAAASIGCVYMDGVSIDGGTYGWSNYHALELSQNINDQPLTVSIINLSLLRGSDMRIDKDSVGWVNVATRTGGVRVDWDGV